MQTRGNKPIRLGELKIPHIEIEEFSLEPTGYDTRLYVQFMRIVQETDYGAKTK